MVETISKVAIAVLGVAAIAAVVRKGSQAPAVINNSLTGFAKVVTAAGH